VRLQTQRQTRRCLAKPAAYPVLAAVARTLLPVPASTCVRRYAVDRQLEPPAAPIHMLFFFPPSVPPVPFAAPAHSACPNRLGFCRIGSVVSSISLVTWHLRATVQLAVASCCDHSLRPCVCLCHPANHHYTCLRFPCWRAQLGRWLRFYVHLWQMYATPSCSGPLLSEVIIARLTPATSTRAVACTCWRCSGLTGLSLRLHAAGDTLCRCMYTCTVCSDLALATSLQRALSCLYSQRMLMLLF
jgi:hypothetical protein